MENLTSFSPGSNHNYSDNQYNQQQKVLERLNQQAQFQKNFRYAFSPTSGNSQSIPNNIFSQNSPSQQSKISMKSPQTYISLRNHNNIEETRRLPSVELDRPLKSEDTYIIEKGQSLGSDQDSKNLDSIYNRIQNLRKNLQNQQSIQQNFQQQQQQHQQLQQEYPPSHKNTMSSPMFYDQNTEPRRSQKDLTTFGKNSQQQFSKAHLHENTDPNRQVFQYGVMQYKKPQDFQYYEENENPYPKNNLSPQLLTNTNEELNLSKLNDTQERNRALALNLYTFNASEHHFKQQNPQNLQTIQDMIKETEKKVKRETEQQFQEKITELERRSEYLDRSLELIEEMKQKFHQFENQQANYNDLLMKYNSLLYQFNSQSQSQIVTLTSKAGGGLRQNQTLGQRTNENEGSPLRDSPSQIKTSFIEDQILELGGSSGVGIQNMKLYKIQNDYENGNNAIQSTLQALDQSVQKLSKTERENQILREQNEMLQIEIERLKIMQQTYKNRSQSSHAQSRKHSPQSASLRNRINQSNIIGTKKPNLNKSLENIRSSATRRPCQQSQSRTFNLVNISTKNENNDIQNFQKETFVQLHKKIDKLEKEKASYKNQVKNFKRRIAEIQESSQMPLQCCCEELKAMYEDRNHSLEQIGDHWKSKTQLLVNKYYKSLQLVRDDQQKLRSTTMDGIEQLRQFQEKMIGDILQKQGEMVVYYEKRLRKLEKENKKMSKRLIQTRNNKETTVIDKKKFREQY